MVHQPATSLKDFLTRRRLRPPSCLDKTGEDVRAHPAFQGRSPGHQQEEHEHAVAGEHPADVRDDDEQLQRLCALQCNNGRPCRYEHRTEQDAAVATEHDRELAVAQERLDAVGEARGVARDRGLVAGALALGEQRRVARRRDDAGP